MARASGYAQPSDWPATKQRILHRDDYRCYVCGGDAITADHITPVARGGAHDDTNLAAICQTCHDNKTKQEAAQGSARRRQARHITPLTEEHPNR